MNTPKIIIPDSKEKLNKQIKALEYQIKKDTTDKDREIHMRALKDLKRS